MVQMVRFDGDTINDRRDTPRLIRQQDAVFAIMSAGRWMTIPGIKSMIWDRFKIEASEASISARIRDFRKERFGGYTVNRRRRDDLSPGLHEYQLVVEEGAKP